MSNLLLFLIKYQLLFLKVSGDETSIPRENFVTLYEFNYLKFRLSDEETSLLYQYGLYNPDLPKTQIPLSFAFDYGENILSNSNS